MNIQFMAHAPPPHAPYLSYACTLPVLHILCSNARELPDVQHDGKRVWTTNVGDLPVVLSSHSQATTPAPAQHHDTELSHCKEVMSPALSEFTNDLPTTTPSSCSILSLNSSLANSPDTRTNPELDDNTQEEDSDFIVPMLEIEVSPENSLISTSTDSLVSIPSITPDPEPFSDSHVPYTPSDSSLVLVPSLISNPLSTTPTTTSSLFAPDTFSTDPDSTDFETTLSTSTSEQFNTSDYYLGMNNRNIVDLHAITDLHMESKPFIMQVNLYGPGAKTSCFQANVDDSAMVNVLNLRMYHKAARHLRRLTPSNRILHIANGSEVPSHDVWTGTLQWNKAKIQTLFEVFDSGGVWSMLIRKPLLEQLQVVHDYTTDTIIIPHASQSIIIKNVHNALTIPRMSSEGPSPCFLVISIPADVIDPSSPEPTNIVSVTEQFIFQAK
ncbi:hypothetical protein F4604DRAFT_1919080 [Suillus subluteus]|nr:hypothetical protein F4604DRAFT_1919080 [Suillus subluteus]